MFLESRNIHDSKNAPDTNQASEAGGCAIGRGETGNTGDTRDIGDTGDTGDTLKENHKLFFCAKAKYISCVKVMV